MITEDKKVENLIGIGEDELRRTVSSEMMRMGFGPALRGFLYFGEMILNDTLYGADNSLENKYKLIAEKFKTTVPLVERNVRTLIQTAFKNGSGYNILNNYFSIEVLDACPPSNGQMLALMDEYIILILFEKHMGLCDEQMFADKDDTKD